jgi:hypothetical protein
MKPFRVHLNKKHIAFFTVTPLLLLTSAISSECPVCSGSGQLSSTPGMRSVEILSSASKELLISRDVCTSYVVYAYTISLTLRNNGTSATNGYVKAVLKEYSTGKVLDSQYLPVNVPELSTVEDKYDIAFKAGLDQPTAAKVETMIEYGDFACKVCSGDGKIAIGSWLLARALEKNYQEVVRFEHIYTPPAYNPPDIEDAEIFWIPPPDDSGSYSTE